MSRELSRVDAGLEGFQLADPEYCSTLCIDLILGVDVFSRIIQRGLRRASLEQPIVQQTSFGWISSGRVFAEDVLPQEFSANHVSADLQLNELVKNFWAEQEEFIDSADAGSECEEHFKSTFSRDNSGRYVVRLPFESSPNQLGDSRKLALKMLYRLDTRFAENPELRTKYKDFLREY